MKAVFIAQFGGTEGLEVREVTDPALPQGSQVLVRVKAAGLNRADLLQRRGLYPPPPGISPNIPGLEFAGEVAAVGPDASLFAVGDRVFGITAGEAQSEYLLTDELLITRIPDRLSSVEAAAIPEAFITAYDALFSQAGLKTGETLLIHAVGSGVGLASLQLAKAFGARVLGTSRSKDKLDRCREFGLDAGFVPTATVDFAEFALAETSGRGVDVILDLVGAEYFSSNIRALAVQGRLMLVGLSSGSHAEFDLGDALRKRFTIIGTVLRSRSFEEKAKVARRFTDHVVPLIESGTVHANVDRVFPLADVRSAHEYLESNKSFGKVVVEF
ncbi:MAG: NAD(P)H-quinone oxidoreductase [Pyrinomonadaceae bacterium]